MLQIHKKQMQNKYKLKYTYSIKDKSQAGKDIMTTKWVKDIMTTQ